MSKKYKLKKLTFNELTINAKLQYLLREYEVYIARVSSYEGKASRGFQISSVL